MAYLLQSSAKWRVKFDWNQKRGHKILHELTIEYPTTRISGQYCFDCRLVWYRLHTVFQKDALDIISILVLISLIYFSLWRVKIIAFNILQITIEYCNVQFFIHPIFCKCINTCLTQFLVSSLSDLVHGQTGAFADETTLQETFSKIPLVDWIECKQCIPRNKLSESY